MGGRPRGPGGDQIWPSRGRHVRRRALHSRRIRGSRPLRSSAPACCSSTVPATSPAPATSGSRHGPTLAKPTTSPSTSATNSPHDRGRRSPGSGASRQRARRDPAHRGTTGGTARHKRPARNGHGTPRSERRRPTPPHGSSSRPAPSHHAVGALRQRQATSRTWSRPRLARRPPEVPFGAGPSVGWLSFWRLVLRAC